MDDNLDAMNTSEGLTKLRVSRKSEDIYSVFFPFSDVPVEMSSAYFKKNISPDKYVIDFEDDRIPNS